MPDSLTNPRKRSGRASASCLCVSSVNGPFLGAQGSLNVNVGQWWRIVLSAAGIIATERNCAGDDPFRK